MTFARRSIIHSVLAVLLTLLPLVGTALADPRETAPGELVRLANSAFRKGDYRRAVELGQASGTAQGCALAAWAELVEGKYIVPRSERLLEFSRAERDARRALLLDANEVEGHLALAVVLGFIGRQEGGWAAHFEGRARDARQQIDIALALAPGNPWANALLGGWHLEIVHDGGLLGTHLYGATLEEGIAAYTRALTLDPENSQIAYQYALELLAMDRATYSDAARSLLSGIARHQSGSALDALIRDRAVAVSSALDAHDETSLARLLKDELGSPQ